MSNQLSVIIDEGQTNNDPGVTHSYAFIEDGPKTRAQTEFIKQVPKGAIHIRPAWTPVKLDEKPPFSYATLIAHAILSSEHRKLTLYEIYEWISEYYPCYSMSDRRWQNSIRHNLSLQKAFCKLDRTSTSPSGKGCFWTILSGYEQHFINNLVKHGLGSSRHYRGNKMTGSNQPLITEPKQKSSHLFTMFRMSPTNKPKKKRKQKQPEKKYQPETEYRNDSDCDSGVDVGELVSSKTEMALDAAPTDNNFFTAQHSSAVCFDNIATPSSIIDQSLLATTYWPTLLLDNIPQFNNNVELYSDLLFDTSSSYSDNLFLPSSSFTQSPITYQYS